MAGRSGPGRACGRRLSVGERPAPTLGMVLQRFDRGHRAGERGGVDPDDVVRRRTRSRTDAGCPRRAPTMELTRWSTNPVRHWNHASTAHPRRTAMRTRPKPCCRPPALGSTTGRSGDGVAPTGIGHHRQRGAGDGGRRPLATGTTAESPNARVRAARCAPDRITGRNRGPWRRRAAARRSASSRSPPVVVAVVAVRHAARSVAGPGAAAPGDQRDGHPRQAGSAVRRSASPGRGPGAQGRGPACPPGPPTLARPPNAGPCPYPGGGRLPPGAGLCVLLIPPRWARVAPSATRRTGR